MNTDAAHSASGEELVVGSLTLSLQRREALICGRPCPLTTTEFNIVVELARRPTHVLSKDALSELVLHRPREPYDRSIDVHISNIRHKLAQLGGGVEIDTVRAIGYRLIEAPL